MNWDEEDNLRILDSRDALKEDLQDYTIPMVLVGSDVVSLYPNLKVDQIIQRIEDEVKQSDIKFENVDYLEAARYLALNWTAEQCRDSKLRRVLPVRRGKHGTRPGMRGAGPRGAERGDQEQWVFPTDIILQEWERKEIIASVIKIATETMFRKHFYTFGGKAYLQSEGGPIGLRGTCAVARIIMQLFDRKWVTLLEDMGVVIYENIRYMDGGRTLLPPFKAGWRWSQGGIKFCKKWEEEDGGITGLERTRRILADSMGTIEPYLEFTTETEDDFGDKWLPTLDTALRISGDNRILFKFWEKPTNSGKTVNKRTAFGENQKVQILTQEVIRRMANTMDGLERGEYVTILDAYCQKLINSGYREPQIRRIVIAGIKGWRAKVRRCQEEGRKVRRSAKDSLGKRLRTRLIGKSTWFKRRKGNKKMEPHGRGNQVGANRSSNTTTTTPPTNPKSVLFVDQTPGGELASKLRELFMRLEPTVGFFVKVVERPGRSLQGLFPLTTLWDGASCGRTEECRTCYQGADVLPNCTRQSILYENVCTVCVPGAVKKEQVKQEELINKEPTLYVGETSRSIQRGVRSIGQDTQGARKRRIICTATNNWYIMESSLGSP